MAALAGANAVGVVLFGALYALAGVRYLPQAAFLACLVLLFALVTWLWVRVEARHRPLGVVRRLGRAVGGFVIVGIGTPMTVLMPLYWLETQLPREAGLAAILPGTMALVLIALGLTAAVNVGGAVLATALALAARRRR